MRVTVQFYARLRELAGCREWVCDLPDDATVGQVWDAATVAHPAIAQLAGRVSAAVNAEFSALGNRVADGDEVAFLPPVSGG